MSELDHSSVLKIPFPTIELATIACRSLQVDKELDSLKGTKTFSTEKEFLVIEIKAQSIRLLRTMISRLFENIMLVQSTQTELSPEVLGDQI